MDSSVTISEQPSRKAIELARRSIAEFPECFWFRDPAARVETIEDIRLVIQRLRQYGGQHAWLAAQELLRCL